QYQVLKGRARAERVVKDNGLRAEPLLGGRATGPDTDWSRLDPELVDRYLGSIDVEAVPGTRLIKVTFASTDPAFAARMANAHVDAFLRQGLRQRTALNQAGLDFLHARLGELKERLRTSEAALNEFRWRKGILDTDEKKENVVVQQLDDLNAQLSKAEAERLSAEAELRTVEQHGVEALPDLAKNTTFHELQVQLAVADGEYARLAAQFKPTYWAVAELKSKRDKIKSYIDAEIRRVGEATQSAYRAARDKEDRLRARFEEQKRQALQQKDAGVEYALLLREAETNRTLYDSVLARMKEMTVAVEVRASNMSVADRAVPPSAPSGAGRLKSIGFAMLLAAIAGVVLAYVRDAVDDTVKTADDVERYGRMPTLAVVPDTSIAMEPAAWWLRLSGRGPASSGPAIVVRGAPRPACTDAYRELRTALMLSRPGGPPRTLLVASGADAEGKTLTAANLAVAFSKVARSVLLVDADLRRPSCHRLFGLKSTPGLAELLTGQCTLDDVLQPVEGLSVLPAGATPPNPTELLGSGEMRMLLTEVASRFDYVVIDSPAAFGVADATVLSTVVDGVLVVARGGRTRRRHLRTLRSRLARARAPIVGVVLNGGDDPSAPA